MLAVFDRETARPPTGLESYKSLELPRHMFPDELDEAQMEESCKEKLERAYSHSKPNSRKLTPLGHGNGFTFEASPFCSYAHKEGVHVLFAGEVSQWPGINAVDAAHDAFVRNDDTSKHSDAEWLLEFYDSFMGTNAMDATNRALDCLSKVEGSFSFVIYDEMQKRVFAGRDKEGTQPLYWGATEQGQLLIGSALEDVDVCDPTATIFPPGSLFASERHTVAYSPGDQGWVINEGDWPGQLFSFMLDSDGEHFRGVKAIPRITSKGTVCGAVYKVASAKEISQP